VTAPVSKARMGATRLARWHARVTEWRVRSSRAFLLGVVIACGIQVLLDWHATLVEINVLRNAIRQKGENYVGILGKASDDELAARDRGGLERLSHGIFDDEDAVYVRFTDAAGVVVWDNLKPDFADAFRRRGNLEPFVDTYARLMGRDTQRALHDPEALKSHVANSRYKDFAQAWTDATEKLFSSLSRPVPAKSNRGVVVYQDRLHDESHQKDDKVSYAIGTVLGEDGRDVGTVIVAFDMQRTNDAVRFKYLKFSGLCCFFVALIFVQNTSSRRTKLRLLELNATYAAAKSALRESMPADDVRCGDLVACGAIDQSRGPVDGVLWCAADEGKSLLVLVVDPDGEGVDAAAVALHVARTFHSRRQSAAEPTLEDELQALGEAARGIPLTRPLGVLLVRVAKGTGAYRAMCGPPARLRVVGDGGVGIPELRPSQGDLPAGVLGPLACASGILEPGTSLVAIYADTSKVDPETFCNGVAKYVARTHEAGKVVPIEDAAVWARGRTAALAGTDIAIVAVSRIKEG
jgi:hypothetical protein